MLSKLLQLKNIGSKKVLVKDYVENSFHFSHRVLMANNGLEEGLGSVQWELVGCLGLAWLMVYLIVWKGLHQSGKVTNFN